MARKAGATLQASTCSMTGGFVTVFSRRMVDSLAGRGTGCMLSAAMRRAWLLAWTCQPQSAPLSDLSLVRSLRARVLTDPVTLELTEMTRFEK